MRTVHLQTNDNYKGTASAVLFLLMHYVYISIFIYLSIYLCIIVYVPIYVFIYIYVSIM